MSTCAANDCDLQVFEDNKKCVLHCKKNEEDIRKKGNALSKSFFDSILKLITQKMYSAQKEGVHMENGPTFQKYNKLSENEIKRLLTTNLKNTEDRKGTNSLYNNLEGFILEFKEIEFPSTPKDNSNNYILLLKELRAIKFTNCIFHLKEIYFGQANCAFISCIFQKPVTIHNIKLIEGNNALYTKCIFNSGLCYSGNDEQYSVIDNPLFNDCSFSGDINFNYIKFNAPIFVNADSVKNKKTNTEGYSLYLISCIVTKKFILNKQNINKFILKDSLFEKKFEFKSNKSEIFKVHNTNFSELADFYKTIFHVFLIRKSIFEKFVGFEFCEFMTSINYNLGATFQYVTFMSFVNFRNTKFEIGLDIEKINFIYSPNFLNAQIETRNTNRETYRIIKHSFDVVGNHLEANKYFSHEMRVYQEELSKASNVKNLRQKKGIFFFNKYTSDFGQNYLWPIYWLIATAISYKLIVDGYNNNVAYKVFSPDGVFEQVSRIFNNIAKHLPPFSKYLQEGMEFVSLLFYLLFSVLIWQIIVAVKRHTRR